MSTATATIKIDDKLKNDAQALAEELGMSFGTLVKVLLKQAVRKKGIRVDTREELYPSEAMTPEMERAIAEVDADIRAGRTQGPFTPDEFLAILDREIEKNKAHEQAAKATKRRVQETVSEAAC